MSEEMESKLLNTTMSRRGFVAMTGAAGLTAFLAACGGSDSGSSSSAGGSSAAAAKIDPATEPATEPAAEREPGLALRMRGLGALLGATLL